MKSFFLIWGLIISITNTLFACPSVYFSIGVTVNTANPQNQGFVIEDIVNMQSLTATAYLPSPWPSTQIPSINAISTTASALGTGSCGMLLFQTNTCYTIKPTGYVAGDPYISIVFLPNYSNDLQINFNQLTRQFNIINIGNSASYQLSFTGGLCSTPCPSAVTITGTYTTPLTESSTWIQSSGTTTIPTGSTVKLDANPTNGYVLLNTGFEAQTGSVFVAQALDGCGSLVPMRLISNPTIVENDILSKPLSSTTKLSVYPNPTTGEITVQHFENTQNIRLYDITGKLLLSKLINNDAISTDLNLNFLHSGFYFISIDNNTPIKLVKE